MPKGENLRKLSDADRQEIVQQYTTPNPDGTWNGSNVIAVQWNVVPQAIIYTLRRAGVPIRSAKEAHAHGKQCKPVKNIAPDGVAAPLCKCGCGTAVGWNQRKNAYATYCPNHYRKEAPYKSRDWLFDHYVIKAHTLEEIATMCSVHFGIIAKFMRKFGIQARDKSASRVGRHMREQNVAWKGGVTPERQRLYKAGNWCAIVQAIYARDGFTCQRCGSPKNGPKSLHAHHLEAWADNVALRFDPSNLITLCRKCHTWVHSRQNTEHEYLK